eukprot:4884872-Pyramimonas_sp.AAC.1
MDRARSSSRPRGEQNCHAMASRRVQRARSWGRGSDATCHAVASAQHTTCHAVASLSHKRLTCHVVANPATK